MGTIEQESTMFEARLQNGNCPEVSKPLNHWMVSSCVRITLIMIFSTHPLTLRYRTSGTPSDHPTAVSQVLLQHLPCDQCPWQNCWVWTVSRCSGTHLAANIIWSFIDIFISFSLHYLVIINTVHSSQIFVDSSSTSADNTVTSSMSYNCGLRNEEIWAKILWNPFHSLQHITEVLPQLVKLRKKKLVSAGEVSNKSVVSL